MTPIPADTFMVKTSQISQNCGVLCASLRCTLPWAIIGLPGRIVTLPTRIYALFDYPPEYGLASALSLVFVLITVAALFLQRACLAP